MILTFHLSLSGAVVAEKALHQSFLRAPRLQSLFLHQPQQSTCFISSCQRPHLTHTHTFLTLFDSTLQNKIFIRNQIFWIDPQINAVHKLCVSSSWVQKTSSLSYNCWYTAILHQLFGLCFMYSPMQNPWTANPWTWPKLPKDIFCNQSFILHKIC